jgi:hypothetical protein
MKSSAGTLLGAQTLQVHVRAECGPGARTAIATCNL